MENSIEFFLNTHLEWSLSRQDLVIILWITGAFYISPTWEVEAIAGLIPIYFHLDKLIGHHHLWVTSLPMQHTINALLDKQHSK